MKVFMIRKMPVISPGSVATFGITLIVSSTLAFICYFYAGKSLDLFLAGIFLSALLTPPLTAFARQMPGACRMAVALMLAINSIWLATVVSDVIDARQWILCALVLSTFTAALLSTTILAKRMGCSPPAASCITTTAALLWLTWPIWLSPSLPGTNLHWSVAIHPLFAINKIVANLGIWTEQQGAYGLTTIGQDVQYQMPASPWPAIVFQSALVGTAILVAWFIAPRSMNQIDTDANPISSK